MTQLEAIVYALYGLEEVYHSRRIPFLIYRYLLE